MQAPWPVRNTATATIRCSSKRSPRIEPRVARTFPLDEPTLLIADRLANAREHREKLIAQFFHAAEDHGLTRLRTQIPIEVGVKAETRFETHASHAETQHVAQGFLEVQPPHHRSVF